MNNAACQAVKEIEAMKKNPVIMQFVLAEAYARVAEEMNKAGSGITAKGVALLAMGRKETNRAAAVAIEKCVNAGLVGCLMAKYSA